MIECMTPFENIIVGGSLAYALYRILRYLWKEFHDVKGEKHEQ